MKIIYFGILFMIMTLHLTACSNMKQDKIKMNVQPNGFLDGVSEWYSLFPDEKEFNGRFEMVEDRRANRTLVTTVDKQTGKPFSGIIEVYDKNELVAQKTYDNGLIMDWQKFYQNGQVKYAYLNISNREDGIKELSIIQPINIWETNANGDLAYSFYKDYNWTSEHKIDLKYYDESGNKI